MVALSSRKLDSLAKYVAHLTKLITRPSARSRVLRQYRVEWRLYSNSTHCNSTLCIPLVQLSTVSFAQSMCVYPTSPLLSQRTTARLDSTLTMVCHHGRCFAIGGALVLLRFCCCCCLVASLVRAHAVFTLHTLYAKHSPVSLQLPRCSCRRGLARFGRTVLSVLMWGGSLM